MLFPQLTRVAARVASRRAFSASSKQCGAHFKEGVYTNIPVKVHNRKIPFALIHFGWFTLGFLVPFISSYVQLKKSGVL
ncbi:LAFA_0G12112g1_1 [Lachancea sp. 'fantastica']|nr:LAFA_0G12112g1_1 [Lachancea sp. 'fantastica']